MSAEGYAPSWRQLRVSLRELGARPVRTRGSHETWRFDDGETFIVIVNHLADSVPMGIRVKFRRLRSRRRAPTVDEPALLGLAGSG
jgi:predicted RNA binding protein YcfA (HicA-like mRNA interferase family)